MTSAWPTPCPWFRLLNGMCMVDLLYLIRHKFLEKYGNMGVITFADRVCVSLTERNRNAPSRTPVTEREEGKVQGCVGTVWCVGSKKSLSALGSIVDVNKAPNMIHTALRLTLRA